MGSHKRRILVGKINRFSVVVYWMDMILLLLCCVPETGVHSPSSRVQSDWAGHSDCHDLSHLTWHSSAPGEHKSQVRGCSGHCMCVAIGTPVTFFFLFVLACVELHRHGLLCATTQCANRVVSLTRVTKLHTHAEGCGGKKKRQHFYFFCKALRNEGELCYQSLTSPQVILFYALLLLALSKEVLTGLSDSEVHQEYLFIKS